MTVGEYYERYWTDGEAGQHGEIKPGLAALIKASVRSGMRCLDVGCGDAHSAGPLVTQLGCDYTGVDVSEAAVKTAVAAGYNVRKIEDAASLPFADGSFDVAICLEVLEHLFQPQLATREMQRVLRPGGLLILTVPNIAYWRRRLDLALLGRWNPLGDELAVEQPWRDPHIRFFNPGALRRMLLQSGFAEVRVAGHGGAFMRDLPWLGSRMRGRPVSRVYTLAEEKLPSLLAYRLHAIARKPSIHTS